ncbi:MAG: hypothetical protein H0W78_15930 [Planctomycetes bacterium]|nr:hypothetical protein [Planctomycetota bacterium]
MRRFSVLVVASLLLFASGCSRASWTRTDMFSTAEAGRSQQTVNATIESLAVAQRGLNLRLDEPVTTDQGVATAIFIEQQVEFPASIILMKRVRVHFDQAGSPLYIEELKPPTP